MPGGLPGGEGAWVVLELTDTFVFNIFLVMIIIISINMNI